jgi:hypothetical protein
MGLWDKVKDYAKDPVKLIGATIGIPTAIAAAGTALVAAPVVGPGMAAHEMYKAGETAKEIAAKNAAAEKAATEERLRILKEENARSESSARARAAASGLSGASTELYVNALIESGRQDIDWLKQVGAYAYESALSEGETAYQQARAAMWGNIGAMGSNILSSFKMMM